jgi:hypothetical protein
MVLVSITTNSCSGSVANAGHGNGFEFLGCVGK